MIHSFAYTNGKEDKQVLNDLLSYIIGSFNPENVPDKNWRYTKEQNHDFHLMMVDYLRVMDEQLMHNQWFDAWGDLFMELTPSGGYRGQFFTPVHLCDLMAEATIDTSTEPTMKCGAFGRRVTISDPAAGSGRNLLAAHVRFVNDNKRKPYLVAEDLDLMCCKMSAVNMLVHGCFGEVICHNTLSDPKGVLVGYIVNEGMYPMEPGFPTVRIRKEPQWFVSLR